MAAHLPETIVYVRHPECSHNVDYDEAVKTCTTFDSPLTPLGEKQMKIISEYLLQKFGSFDKVFASAFYRAQTIPSFADFDFVVDGLLNERNQGLLHEIGPKAYFERFPEDKEKVEEAYYHYLAPGGETCLDVEARALKFLSNQDLFLDCKTILISGHGVAGKCFRKVLTGASEKDWHAWDRLHNASVSVYQKQVDGFVCTEYNYVPWAGQLENQASFAA